ncbi:MAG: membrane protein insertase YidC [Elusimicrobia bacterium]|nr:membrane protein insertase YidC [Elusimicrobiota bacterium]
MQKNLILALVLSSLVYLLWYSFLEKRYGQSQKSQITASAGVESRDKAVTGAAKQPKTDYAKPVEEKRGEVKKNWTEKAVSLKTSKSEILLDLNGANIRSYVYQGPVSPVELVISPEYGIFNCFDDLAFRLLDKTGNMAVFEAQTQNMVIRKKLVFSPENKLNTLEISATNKGSQSLEMNEWALGIGPGLGTASSEQKENTKVWSAKYAVKHKDRKNPSIITLKENAEAPGWIWAGLDNRYFIAAVTGEGIEKRNNLNFSQMEIDKNKAPYLSIPFEKTSLAPGQTKSWKMNFYIGPKDYGLLQSIGQGLAQSVDFGFFAPLAKLANSSLVYFYDLSGNYGVAIIIISVIVQIIIFPLSWKSYKAMNIMKKIQPQIQYLQQKYKNDPKRLNAEILDIYKKHGANPLGGCLPMLLQIPIFFALFTALRNSWNLHGAPFMFWIKDLSAKDPFYVMPVVMGLIMFLQQHFNPQSSEPSQAMIMKWMPVIFTFMFLSFPSGLVLYWLINSIFGFAQQMYMQKAFKGDKQ